MNIENENERIEVALDFIDQVLLYHIDQTNKQVDEDINTLVGILGGLDTNYKPQVGKIYSGFACIGKSSVARKKNSYIDLESSSFKINGYHKSDWYITYCNVLEDLVSQGFNVFISSHQQVRDELHKRNIDFTVITPILELKDQWLERLRKRYEAEPTQSNWLALDGVSRYYDTMVASLLVEQDKIIIDNIDYDLETLIKIHNNK